MRQRGPVRHTLHECAAASSARLKSADGSAPTRMWIQLWNRLIAHAETPAPRAVGVFLPMYTISTSASAKSRMRTFERCWRCPAIAHSVRLELT
jgi:hypothetical protein